ncbi:hypothetical protein Pmar_PMAR011550 [Perkinsus marinus ATCC 50983]|uniref:Uncharacterized protein n=1 Tax=Perkinsus marinus (strain ATCC 50983 / TXsc) TaxID=423536 RepID=C5LC41_PERM5|nr:hypothetical protein Pmar_PMAR011550 [Perkinsus marinus ATCC 50983]EER05524.1 hypothetical protein Pmar_PMAR011550 [Perkinsus marinus ATCC 50983]|eukprot:XP_002773708.1 hypothetical protein Pmar_PMAR011550 [Perkinsus marinus ATCC 50983]
MSGILLQKNLHPSQDHKRPYWSLYVPGGCGILNSALFALPPSQDGQAFEEPPLLYKEEGYMIRFMEEPSDRLLAIEELRCPVGMDASREARSWHYVFPQGLQHFKLALPEYDGASFSERFYRIRRSERLSDSLRLIYYGTHPDDGEKAPVGDTKQLLLPIMKAFCKYVRDELANRGKGYSVLRHEPFMKVELDAESPQNVVKDMSEAMPATAYLKNSTNPAKLWVAFPKWKRRPIYTVKSGDDYVKFVVEDDRLAVKAMSCPGRKPGKTLHRK